MHVYIEMVLPSFLTLNGLREADETSEAARLLKKTPGLTKADNRAEHRIILARIKLSQS